MMKINKAAKGINLGGWLLMEGYILRGRNIAERQFKKQFNKLNGSKVLREFEKTFRDTFIVKEDFKNIAALGAKIIRLPFNYKLIEENPFSYSEKGFSYFDKAFQWAKEYNLKIILDLHAAPGAQNCDWHADSTGKALLWEKENYQRRTIKLWEVVADRYKDNPALYAYDVLNEPVLGNRSISILLQLYRTLIEHLRRIDKNTLIFLEGLLWAQRIDFLKPLLGDTIGVSIHTYQPLNYVFNYTPFKKYPGEIDGVTWNKKRLRRYLESYYKFSISNKVKVLVGEFGINWRGGYFGESQWLDDILNLFDEFGFDYTYWTYKAIANDVFPDGVYQYLENNAFVNREGPVYGWENYSATWKKHKRKIVNVWHTKRYRYNRAIGAILKKHFKL